MAKSEKSEKFEVSLQKLEDLVQKLESGDLSLEDSMKAFEEGMALVKSCEVRLTEAQKRVEILMKDKSGNQTIQNFEDVE
ncbi:MAG: exodeoxyribonuclease VII small subunit [Deltaproteobacteria bacterium]|nr:MAG: exodeoxyribonuclease VII small subunit [Deltaproteobacteria bacterium]